MNYGKTQNNVIIIIPAHNEEKTVGSIVDRSKKYGTVVVIDDASSDSTGKEARIHGAHVIMHKANRGLGGALKTGFDYALKQKYDIIITLDADGQHVPEEIPLFLEVIKEYDFVLGARDLHGYPFKKRFGNFFLNVATNIISGTYLKDTESGFRAFRREALGKLHIQSERYQIALEIVFEIGRNHLSYTNVPINVPIYVKGVGVMDGIKNFGFLLRRRKRNYSDYVQDFKYVARHWLENGRITKYIQKKIGVYS